MRILFDHSTPDPLMQFLPGHDIVLAKQMGWNAVPDGDLLDLAEGHRFQVLITADKNLPYQQVLSDRRFATIVLGNNNWRIVQRYVRKIATAVATTPPGTWALIEMPKG